ncbi:MAG TPA: dipeptidase [Pyrinomonadaceae bacterium]|nr:dipeptidase [Pyrinomonadaceae bacterium]
MYQYSVESTFEAKVAVGSVDPILSAIAFAQTMRARFVPELKEFIRFSSISAQPQHDHDMKKCAAWLASHLRKIELEHVQITSTRGHPLVYADWLHTPDRPTVLIYGHYDVQPAEPFDKWRSPPFEPVVHGNDLYGRGASDDKGQMFAHIKALESCLRATGRLPVNVKCLFEGEEEVGSPNFQPFLAANKKALAADVVVVSDTAMLDRNRPAITSSMRGSLSLELEVNGAEVDLHDGLFGGAVHNPLKGLCDIIAGLQTSGGRITIPGFYDRVRDVSSEERAYMKSSGPDNDQILSNARTSRAWGEPAYTLYERTTIRPSLTVSGLAGGYQGPGPKSIIPARAGAKLNFRLVPDQNPLEIGQLVRRHIARLTPFTLRSTLKMQLAADPVIVDRGHPLIRAAAVAANKGFGVPPVFVRSGGTNPAVAAFHRTLGVPTALVGFGLPDDHIHAPNEKFHLPNFHKGIATAIWFLHEVAAKQAGVVNANLMHNQEKRLMTAGIGKS